jgi:hypothetical protein
MAAGTALACVCSIGLSACGSSFKGKISLSVSSGPVGTVVNISGDAGKGCVVDTNWLGFDFERFGDLTKGPAMEMTTPIAANGTWSAEFRVPSYLGGSATRGPGGPVSPGRYEVTAPTCKKGVTAVAAFRVTAGQPAGASTDWVAMAVTLDGNGYWLAQADGHVAAYGDARSYGSLPASEAGPATPIVGIAHTYDAKGYWLVNRAGHVFSFGDARSYGSLTASEAAQAPVTNIAATPLGKGYWLMGANGHVYAFGNAQADGSPSTELAPFDAIEPRPAGGYVVTEAANGGIVPYPGGTLVYYGPGSAVSGMFVGTAITPSGNGAWEAGMDGGVYNWGADAKFYGSVQSIGATIKAPITAIADTPAGNGYWLLSADGSLLPFGAAGYFGAPGGKS